MDTLLHLQYASRNLHELRLPRGRTLSFDARRIAAIESLEGTLWATVDGEPTDHVLRRGDALPIRPTCGRIVLEALDRDAVYRTVSRQGVACAAAAARGSDLPGLLARALDAAACRLHRLADRLAPHAA